MAFRCVQHSVTVMIIIAGIGQIIAALAELIVAVISNDVDNSTSQFRNVRVELVGICKKSK